jgi:hypothetical protein
MLFVLRGHDIYIEPSYNVVATFEMRDGSVGSFARVIPAIEK